MTFHFHHEAMATGFEAVISSDRPEAYLRQAAAAAFREVDRLENELSRFIETSDIARINRLKNGDAVIVGEDTMACLVAAARISEATGQAFDPAYLSRREPGQRSLFALDPAEHAVVSLCERLHLDLGAVGKGYALDCMAHTLREWELDRVCVQSGGSTVLALAAPDSGPGWRVTVGDRVVSLAHRAASASGTSVQGGHLIDPRTGQPAPRAGRVWSFADSAAAADALSTAFFNMGDAEIASFCRQHPEFSAAIPGADGTLRAVGAVKWHAD